MNVTRRHNYRDHDLFTDCENRDFDRRYDEYLFVMEAAHERRTKARIEAEKTLSGLRKTQESLQ